MSAGGLVFKGSGFYITDYGKDGKKDQQKPAASSGVEGAPAAVTGKSESSDAKPAGESRTASEAKPAADAKSSGDSKAKSEAKPAKAADSSATKTPPKKTGGDA